MLTTVDAVIDALGGPTITAARAGVGLSAVSNWKARGRFPAELYLLFSTALSANPVDPALFGLRLPEAEARP